MRGIRAETVDRARRVRFTPAYAGNMYVGGLAIVCPGVHPRVCGEYPGLAVQRAYLAGFTPAYAGNILSDQQVYQR